MKDLEAIKKEMQSKPKIKKMYEEWQKSLSKEEQREWLLWLFFNYLAKDYIEEI